MFKFSFKSFYLNHNELNSLQKYYNLLFFSHYISVVTKLECVTSIRYLEKNRYSIPFLIPRDCLREYLPRRHFDIIMCVFDYLSAISQFDTHDSQAV